MRNTPPACSLGKLESSVAPSVRKAITNDCDGTTHRTRSWQSLIEGDSQLLSAGDIRSLWYAANVVSVCVCVRSLCRFIIWHDKKQYLIKEEAFNQRGIYFILKMQSRSSMGSITELKIYGQVVSVKAG